MSHVLIMSAAFLTPVALALWSYRVAIRTRTDGAPPSFFAFAQRTQWAGVLALVGWPAAYLSAQGPGTGSLIEELGAHVMAAPWTGAALAGPPLFVVALIGLLGHDVARRAGLTEWTWRAAMADAVRLVGGGIAAFTLCVAGVGFLVTGHVRAGLFGVAGSIVVAALIGGARRRAAGLTPHAVTTGDLRDHVFALAGRAGVKLRQLYVVPFRRFRLANAFAVQGQVVMLTDQLIDHLDRDEMDAVLLHEMAHLARNDPARIARALLVAGLIAAIPLAMGAGWTLPGFLALAVLAYLAYLRRIEHATDARALALGARPEALVTGLARLGRLSQMPARWSAAREWLMTHPSLERRARRLAAATGADPTVFVALADAPPPAGARWPMPEVITNPRVFNSEFRRVAVGRLSWSLVLAAVIGPTFVVAIATWLEAAGVSGIARPLVFAAALAAGFCAWLFALLVAGHRPMHTLRRTLEPKLRGSIPVRGPASGAFFVGLVPGAEPRMYEGFTAWDVGSLVLAHGQCDYAGEEARFSLVPAEVREVRLDTRMPGWIRIPILRVHWERADGAAGVFGLLPVGRANPFVLGAEARRLLAALETWRAGPAPSGAVEPIGPPPTKEVTGASPRSLVQPQAIVLTWIIQIVLALAISVAIGLPGSPLRAGWFDVAMAAVATQVLAMLPILRYREPADAAAPAVERRAA